MTDLYVGIVASFLSVYRSGSTSEDFFGLLIYLGFLIPIFISLWIIARKAGESGLAITTPVVSEFVLVKITGRSRWWVLPLLLPVACFFLLNQIQSSREVGTPGIVVGLLELSAWVAWVAVVSGLAERFQKGTGFFIALIILPFIALPILAFSKYLPPYQRGNLRTPHRPLSRRGDASPPPHPPGS